MNKNKIKAEIKRIKHDLGDRLIWSILPNTSIGIRTWNEKEIRKRELEIKLIKECQKDEIRF